MKLAGAILMGATYDFCLMTRLWPGLIKSEYRASLRKGRWLTIVGTVASAFLLLELSPVDDPVPTGVKIAFVVVIIAVIVHALFAMRDIDTWASDQKNRP
ncbi:MAG: hypothetical protein ACKOQM_15780 [Novosphingobium sp.]